MSANVLEPSSNRWVFIVNGLDAPMKQMERDLMISRLMGPAFPPLLRIYRISRGATIGRTWQGSIPWDWNLSPHSIAVRPTGGGAVLHGHDLCLSLFISWEHLPSQSKNWPVFYESFHTAIGEFLSLNGIHPTLNAKCQKPGSERTGQVRRNDTLCFADPVKGDLMLLNDKVLGGALAVGRKGVIYQGSLFVPGWDPGVLSGLFEEWYRSNGRNTIDRILLMEGKKIGSTGTICPDRVEGGSVSSR